MRLLEVKEYSEKYNKENKTKSESIHGIFKKGFLEKEDLFMIINVFYSNNKIRNKILSKIRDVKDSQIKALTKQAFNSGEKEILDLLTKIKGVTIKVASEILTFYDPKKYCIFNSHIYDEVFGTNIDTRPKTVNSNKKHYLELLQTIRHFSKKYKIDAKDIGNAFFQKNCEKRKNRTHLIIKEMDINERPREKMLKLGAPALNNSELFAIILRTGSPNENVIEMSNRLIAEHGLDRLFDCSLKELQEIKGIGPSKAMQLLAMAELGKRYNQSKNPITKITNAEDVFNYFHGKLKDEKQEHFYVLILNNANNIIKEELISKGVLDAAILHPREVFKPAIKNSASKIILIHNHPSGNPKPSNEDIKITKKLVEAGKLIDIKILDHVIIGNDSWWSWVEDGN